MDGGAQKNAPRRSRDVHSPAKGYDEAEKQAQSGSGRLQSSRGVSGLSSQGSITVTDSWGISPRSACRKSAAATGRYLICKNYSTHGGFSQLTVCLKLLCMFHQISILTNKS